MITEHSTSNALNSSAKSNRYCAVGIYILKTSLLSHSVSKAAIDFPVMASGMSTIPQMQGSSTSLERRVSESLMKYFKHSTFLPGQLESVPVLKGKDVFVRMATGSGKSLCMFLPALSSSEQAATVVISPSNGLMEQQVYSFLGTIVLL